MEVCRGGHGAGAGWALVWELLFPAALPGTAAVDCVPLTAGHGAVAGAVCGRGASGSSAGALAACSAHAMLPRPRSAASSSAEKPCGSRMRRPRHPFRLFLERLRTAAPSLDLALPAHFPGGWQFLATSFPEPPMRTGAFRDRPAGMSAINFDANLPRKVTRDHNKLRYFRPSGTAFPC